MNAAQAWDLVRSGKPLAEGSDVRFAANVCGGQSAIADLCERDSAVCRRIFMEMYDKLTTISEARRLNHDLPHPNCIDDVGQLLRRIRQ